MCSLLIRSLVLGCRHWDQVRDEIHRVFDQESESFTLEQIVELGMDQHVEKIGEISASATKELAIELVGHQPCPPSPLPKPPGAQAPAVRSHWNASI